MNKFITIATFSYPSEVAIIKGRLESEGIECFIKDELTIQVNNFFSNAIGGIKLQVRENDVTAARAILENAGYAEDGGGNLSKFWEKFDSFSRNLPVLKKQSLEIRLILIIAIVLVLLTPFIYLLVAPANTAYLTKYHWCVDHISYKGKVYKPSPPKYKEGELYIKTFFCDNGISFSKNGQLYLPGFNSGSLHGNWHNNSDEIEIYGVDDYEYIFNGYYSVETDGRTLILRSENTVIYCYRAFY
jgi:hypothetical protein